MRGLRDLIWLLAVVVLLAAAVAYTPYEVAVPIPYQAVYTPTATPDSFTFLCSGSSHVTHYTGFKMESDFPEYTGETSTVDQP